MDSLLEVKRDLLEVAVKWGQGVARQGQPYGWLIDSHDFLLQGDHLERICALLGERVRNVEIDTVAGYTWPLIRWRWACVPGLPARGATGTSI